MKAVLNNKVIAESDDIVENGGYQYFRALRCGLSGSRRREDGVDRECPHGVQFYDVVLDGVRHDRAAWSYEAPRPAMHRSAGASGSGRTWRCAKAWGRSLACCAEQSGCLVTCGPDTASECWPSCVSDTQIRCDNA